jgi:N-formylglutamate amidohydrolase
LPPNDSAAASPALSAAPAGKPGSAPSHSVLRPKEQTIPVVFASPHSGDAYPEAFLAASRLDRLALRRSEDAFVDQLYAGVTAFGAPLLRAHFPRVYIDPNREPFEFDPGMFDGDLPAIVNRSSPRIAAGLGTIARVVASGEEVYAEKLSIAEALARVEQHYFPYHHTLQQLLDETYRRFGCYLLIDCHSMPSVGGPMDADPGSRRVDFVLGDCYGTSCAPAVTNRVDRVLAALGYSVTRNIPYAGGYTTRHYGRPRERRHALQIEVNRALYMDEMRIQPHDGMPTLIAHLKDLFAALASIDVRRLRL